MCVCVCSKNYQRLNGCGLYIKPHPSSTSKSKIACYSVTVLVLEHVQFRVHVHVQYMYCTCITIYHVSSIEHVFHLLDDVAKILWS